MAQASRTCVAVASDQTLVADVVSAALCHHGFDCTVLRWVGGRGAEPLTVHGPSSVALSPPDVAVLVSDFQRAARVRTAVRLMLQVPVSWVVVTALPRGPLWGGLLEAGSAHVMSSTNGLDELTSMLAAVAQGDPVTPDLERGELVGSWTDLLVEHDEVRARLARMTPRETEVLTLLHAGSPVRAIAAQLDVAEATVRTQVKRVLRKLEVRTQLAAVAAFEHGRAEDDVEQALAAECASVRRRSAPSASWPGSTDVRRRGCLVPRHGGGRP